MKTSQTPLVRRIIANLKKHDSDFKIHRHGNDVWIHAYGIELSLIFASGGYANVLRLDLKNRINQRPFFTGNFQHDEEIQILGRKLWQFDFIDESTAVQIFEVSRAAAVVVPIAAKTFSQEQQLHNQAA